MIRFSPRLAGHRKLNRHTVLFVIASLLLLTSAVLPEALLPEKAHANVNTTVSPGWDVFTANQAPAYRYGPSIIVDSTGMHMYTCSPGSNGAWDYIRYNTSTDGGHNWGTEQVVLTPTPGSADQDSTCDPGVIYFGGYYYLGYTSTDAPTGVDNNVFVARSTKQTGPFDKWNGSGWGGDPQPFITYHGNGPSYDYGAGEPSFVVLGSTLFIYYTWWSHDSSTGYPIEQTRVATASTSDDNWPGNITYQGVAISKRPDQGADSDDVKYIDAYQKFVAVNTIQRFSPKASIQMWESTDGIHFSPSTLNSQNLLPYLHNDGLSGDPQGHIDVTQTNYISYAYGTNSADWNTYLQPITFSNDNLPAAPQIYSVEPQNGAIRLEFQTDSKATSYTIKYGTQSGNYTSSVTGITSSPYTLNGLTNGTKYYLVLDGVSADETSVDSAQVSAMPQDYEPITLTNPQPSSTTPGWPASNVIDGDLSTAWSSQLDSSSNAPESISVDAGANTPIGRLVVVSRQPSLVAAPSFDTNLDTQIEVSEDDTNWFPVDYRLDEYQIIADSGAPETVFDFPQPLYGRYIKISSTKLNQDDTGHYYLQIAEIQAYSVPESAIASDYLPGWEPGRVLDADPNTVYSSPEDASANTQEWVGLNLGSPQQITRLLVTPRPTGGQGYGFPVRFAIQSSTDPNCSTSNNWTTIPGQDYTGQDFPNPGSQEQSFSFSPVTAQCIRILATQLGVDDSGNYYLQIAGMAVQNSLAFTATASTSAPGWPVSNVEDGVSSTMWSSNGHTSADATEYLQLDLGSTFAVQDLRVVPRDGYCFPQSFSISYSTDGMYWTPVPGQTYSNYLSPAQAGTIPNPVQLFYFSSPVSARYFKITATQLTADQYTYYYFQLADVFVDQ